jgi:hypothetical protein
LIGEAKPNFNSAEAEDLPRINAEDRGQKPNAKTLPLISLISLISLMTLICSDKAEAERNIPKKKFLSDQ